VLQLKRFYILIISIFLVILLILWIGPSNIINSIKNADWKLLLLALLIHQVAVFVRSIRWGLIIDKPYEFKNNYIVKTIGLFAGNFSPMRTAGELLSAVAGKKINKITISKGLSAGLNERLFDMIIVGILLVLSSIWISKVRFLSIIGAFLSLGFVFLIYFLNWREDTSIWLYKKIHPIIEKLPIKQDIVENIYIKSIKGLKGMVEHTKSFTSSKNLILVLILSFTSWILESIRLLTVFYAFNVNISLVAVIIIFLIANLIGIISALPGGIGSIELSLTGLFLLFGVPSALAGSIALVDRLLSFWVVSALGLIFSFYYARDILTEIKSYSLDFTDSEK
jgi:glycosyltransferase 2 family protein